MGAVEESVEKPCERGMRVKVLFIGGTGVISAAVSQLAVERGLELVLLNRGNQPDLIPPGARVITGNIHDRSLTGILARERFDVVVDWIAFTSEHTAVDIARFRDHCEQFIFISSASVYQKPVTQHLITESTPLVNPFWQYSRDKIQSEELLLREYRDHGFPVTIVRPSYTYGDRLIPASLNSGSKPWSLVDRMRRGRPIVVHGDGSALWTMTHNTDFAKAFVGLMGNPLAIGHAFHITSDEVLSWDQIYQTIGRACGATPNIVHIASDFIAAALPEEAGGLIGDKTGSAIFDNQKIKRWVPEFQATVSFAQGMGRAISWFDSHPSAKAVDEAWNQAIDALLAAYGEGLKAASRIR